MVQKPVKAELAADVFDAIVQEVSSLVSSEKDKDKAMAIMSRVSAYMRVRRELLRYMAQRKETT